jgi:hypothetical protein
MSRPAISIVVPAMSRGKPLEETLRSLEEQDYPGLQVIVAKGDGDLAATLNQGFAGATGEILAYLKPGERLLPDALQRVATQIDPGRGRHVVMGRSLFVLEAQETGVEHPREYLGPSDHLAIWKRGFNPVPQSSVFWHRSVWELCGPFAADPECAVDYAFICRVGARYPIHAIDCMLSACRVDGDSPAARLTEAEQLEILIAVSRRHWGSLLAPRRWRCQLSHWLYQGHLHERARHHARKGEAAAAEGSRFVAAVELVKTLALSPAMARGRWRRFLPRPK